jgi:hypothetical protein
MCACTVGNHIYNHRFDGGLRNESNISVRQIFRTGRGSNLYVHRVVATGLTKCRVQSAGYKSLRCRMTATENVPFSIEVFDEK